jgi:phytoene dehydrogenase-like protein
MAKTDVVIVGGGLAGLCCALHLQQHSVECVVLEGGDRPGGRVRTDEVDGFLLDRGFQVLLTAYPEARRMLDYEALLLAFYEPGALVRAEGSFHRIADPMRDWTAALSTLAAPVGTLADKMRILKLRSGETVGDAEISTIDALRQHGFSSEIIERFFRPFFRGIFLEPDLATSERKFAFIFQMFSTGHAALPAHGMQAIPDQLASRLQRGTLRTGARVESIGEGEVRLESGEAIACDAVVLAVEQPECARLTNGAVAAGTACATTCLYFDAPEPPVRGSWLVLNGDGRGPVNNLSVPSEVHASYAPAGRALVSVSVLGNAPRGIEDAVRAQLTEWYGRVTVEQWRLLRTVPVRYALPLQAPPALTPVEKPSRLGQSLFVCGDHREIASIQGAMASGRRAAEAILKG